MAGTSAYLSPSEVGWGGESSLRQDGASLRTVAWEKEYLSKLYLMIVERSIPPAPFFLIIPLIRQNRRERHGRA